MEVLEVSEGKELWARRIAQHRRHKNIPLPTFMMVTAASSRNSRSSGNEEVLDLIKKLLGLSKELGRSIVSFI